MKTRFLNTFTFLVITILATSCDTTPDQKWGKAQEKGLAPEIAYEEAMEDQEALEDEKADKALEKAHEKVVKKAEKDLFDATKKLEMVEDSQNYSGKIAVSDPEFVVNKGQFTVNFVEDASNYVQAARQNISAGANSSVQTAMYLGALLQGSFTSPVSAGAPPGSNTPPSQVSLPNQAETAINSFPAPLSLDVNPTTDERDAVEKGINDKLAERFLEFMANPDLNSNRQAIVFGVMEATCQPGQNTRKGFIAELDISLKYARQNHLPLNTHNSSRGETLGNNEDSGLAATNRPNEEGRDSNGGEDFYQIGQDAYPSVAAVLPLMDTRNMALENNNQSQIEVAAALSAAFAAKGMSAAANILSDYVKRQESNIETRNSLPVATTYSDGGEFGIQLYPSVQAIENPGKTGSPAADVLEPITFPIVVALKVDKSDLNPAGGPPWSFVATQTQTRWIPMKSDLWQLAARKGITVFIDDLFDYSQLYQRVLRAKNIDGANRDLMDVNDIAPEFPDALSSDYANQYQQVLIALDSMESSELATLTYHTFPSIKELFPPPDTNTPSITSVYPHFIWRDTNTDFEILVKRIADTNDIASVNIAGVDCKPINIVAYTSPESPDDSSIVTNIAFEASLPQVFSSITNNVTNNVDFVVAFNHDPPATKTIGMLLQGKTTPEANATIARDSNGKVLGIDIKPGQNLAETNLLDAVEQVLRRSEEPPKTITIVR